jgi:methylmalonyl-CoA mutase N-terminal domain/subunit
MGNSKGEGKLGNLILGAKRKEIFAPEDMSHISYDEDIGMPGHYPYTRGIHEKMYGKKSWTQKLLCGFGTPAETNQRLKVYISHGLNAIDIIPDMPSWIGIDADHPRSKGEVGVQGVSLTSFEDFETLYDGISLELPLISHNVNAMASPFAIASWSLLAEKRGKPLETLRGTFLNDPLFSFYGGWWPEGKKMVDLAMKLSVDAVEFCSKNMPQVYCLYSDGYDFREEGVNAVQELAIVLSKAVAYLEMCMERGLSLSQFAHRLSFCFSMHNNFFEEIAKIRAARRMWARICKERFGCEDEKINKLKFSVHTAGCTLISAQPKNNIVRIAYQAMAAALAGAQAMDLCCYDEAVNIPSEEAGIISLRTQQILAYETGITEVGDPLGGSYYIENLTCELENAANDVMAEFERQGGIEKAVKTNWLDRMIEKESLKYQREIEDGSRIIVGKNEFKMDEDESRIDYHKHDPASGENRIAAVKKLKQERDNVLVKEKLLKLKEKARLGEKQNLIPAAIEAARVHATVGEIGGMIREGFGHRYDPFGELENPFK